MGDVKISSARAPPSPGPKALLTATELMASESVADAEPAEVVEEAATPTRSAAISKAEEEVEAAVDGKAGDTPPSDCTPIERVADGAGIARDPNEQEVTGTGHDSVQEVEASTSVNDVPPGTAKPAEYTEATEATEATETTEAVVTTKEAVTTEATDTNEATEVTGTNDGTKVSDATGVAQSAANDSVEGESSTTSDVEVPQEIAVPNDTTDSDRLEHTSRKRLWKSTVGIFDEGDADNDDDMMEIIAVSEDDFQPEPTSTTIATNAAAQAGIVTLAEAEPSDSRVEEKKIAKTAMEPSRQPQSNGRRRKRSSLFSSARNKSTGAKRDKKQHTLSVTTNIVDTTHDLPLQEQDKLLPGGVHPVTTPAPAAAKGTSPKTSTSKAGSTGLFPSAGADVATWHWSSCDVYFDPIPTPAMDDLIQLRRNYAGFVAAHRSGNQRTNHLNGKEVVLSAIIADAPDKFEDSRVRSIPRGRSYQDVWEEEDFLLAEWRLGEIRAGKKRPFAGCDVLTSNSDLVRGYNDMLYSAYRNRLEKIEVTSAGAMVTPCEGHSSIDNAAPTTNRSKRKLESQQSTPIHTKTSQPFYEPYHANYLPAIPVQVLHPASCGAWSLAVDEQVEMADDTNINSPSLPCLLHPACLGRVTRSEPNDSDVPETKISEDETGEKICVSQQQTAPAPDSLNKGPEVDGKNTTISDCQNLSADDNATNLKKPEVMVCDESTMGGDDNDEIALEIENSIAQLVSLSASNWEQIQTLTERAACHIATTPILAANNAVQQRLEKLYWRLHPRARKDFDAVTQAQQAPGHDRHHDSSNSQFISKPHHLVELSGYACGDNSEAVAVGASVEFAMRLKVGDELDALDRNGCWNSGVVLDLFVEGGTIVKFVRVSFSMWGDDSVEWIGVTEGRILPRGVADGRATFVVGATPVRKRRLEMNQELAHTLEKTYDARRIRLRSSLASSSSLAAATSKQKKMRLSKHRPCSADNPKVTKQRVRNEKDKERTHKGLGKKVKE